MKLARVYLVGAIVSSGCFALAAWGCSSSKSPSSTVVGTGQTTGKFITAAQGGTVTLAGSTLTIPPGALANDTDISITSTTSAPPTGVTNLSPLYQFTPSGLQFLKPVTVALQFTAGNDPTLVWSQPSGSGYGVLPSNTTGSTLTGMVTHFSTGFVADGTTLAALAGGATDAGALDAAGAWDGSCAVCEGVFCAGECTAPYTTCGSACINTQTDLANCGACGNACATGMVCADGACTTTCQASTTSGTCGGQPLPDGGVDCSTCMGGYAACGSSCANLQASPSNCGACGVSCNGGVCQNGACVPVCPTAGQVCSNSACVSACPTGQTSCTTDGGASACTDVTSDSQNCGACGTACGAGKACASGACVQACGTQGSFGTCSGGTLADGGPDCSHCIGDSPCGSACVTLSSDPKNCGACGNVCPTGQFCSNGTCGASCPTGDVCFNQACVPACPAGWAVCPGSVNPNPLATPNECTPLSSAESCGACGHACPSGQGCSNGACTGQCTSSSSGGGTSSGGGGVSVDAGQ